MGISVWSAKRCALTCLLAMAGLTPPIMGQAVFIGLNDLSESIAPTVAHGISADGSTVVGNASFDGDNRAFAWTSIGGMVNLGDLPGGTATSAGYAASANGAVVIGEGRSNIGTEPFLWTGGVMTGLGILSGVQFSGIANHVSDDGLLVVGGNTSGLEAFYWTDAGGMTLMGFLPGGTVQSSAWGVSGDGLVIVGHSRSDKATIYCSSSSCTEAFSWTLGGGFVGLSDLVSPVFPHRAQAASADGSVIVGLGSNTTTSVNEAFRWTSGSMVGLGDLAGGVTTSWAYDVSGDGSIVVGDSNDGSPTAFIWDAGNGMRNLKDVLETDYGLDLTDWQLTRATGISDDGNTIVGFGINPGGTGEAWIAALNGLPVGCIADVDSSGTVDVNDLIPLLADWGLVCPPPELFPCPTDINGDGTIDVDDLIILLAMWGACP